MDELKKKIEGMISAIGFRDFDVSIEPVSRKVSATINDPIAKSHLADLVLNFSSLVRVMAKKLGLDGEEPIIFDINNYRKERDSLIVDLAKAAARKVVGTKETVQLPPMNAYERRLVHAELSMRPDVKTESIGEGKDRYILVKWVD